MDMKRETLRLGYRRPYAWGEMLAYYRDRAIAGIEAVNGVYARWGARLSAERPPQPPLSTPALALEQLTTNLSGRRETRVDVEVNEAVSHCKR